MLTPEAINKLGIKIDSSIVQAYTPPSFKDIWSFIGCVLPQGNSKIGYYKARWIVYKYQRENQFHAIDFFSLKREVVLTQSWNIQTLVQWIFNAIFTSVCKISLERKNKPERNCTWISDLSIENKKLSTIIHLMNQGRK